MDYRSITLGVAATGALMLSATAGEEPTSGAASSLDQSISHYNCGDWCKTLQNIGKLYKNEDTFVQNVKLFGRYHHQWTYADGNNNGDDFSGFSQELRRFRVGASFDFADRWYAYVRINLEDGNVNANSVSHQDIDGWEIRYTHDDIGILKDPNIGYGLYKINFGGEWYASSKKIKTVERSNLANEYAPLRATGSFLSAHVGEGRVDFGIFSGEEQGYGSANWNGGIAYFASAQGPVAGGTLRGDVLIVDADEEEDEIFGFDWAGSLTYDKDFGNGHLFVNGTYGSNVDGDIYGVVVMPSYFIVPEKVEAVFRYAWTHATADLIQAGSSSHNSIRTAAAEDGLTVLPGSDSHAFYLGLNFHLCDQNCKVLTGIEYETLDGDNTDTEAVTLWSAIRFYF